MLTRSQDEGPGTLATEPSMVLRQTPGSAGQREVGNANSRARLVLPKSFE